MSLKTTGPRARPSVLAGTDHKCRTTPKKRHTNPKAFIGLLILVAGLVIRSAHATGPFPPPSQPWLDYFEFNNTNSWVSERGYFPASFTNVGTCMLGEFLTANLDSTNAAWLRYNVTEADGTNHLTFDAGTIMFWFAPNWTGTNEGGTGPGEWSRLLEVGSYTTNASYGWFSFYTDPDGVNLYFGAQTNDGSGALYLSAPIDWNITNRWHLLALTYSSTNSTLYLDGEFVTNGAPVTYWPGPDVLTNGFLIGSDSNGTAQAHGMFDNFSAYNYPLDGTSVLSAFRRSGIWFYANPYNKANIGSAHSTPSTGPTFNAVTGAGNLAITNADVCITNSNVWITNAVVSMASNGTMNVQFTIEGGLYGAMYDVFANSVLDFSTSTNSPWAWMGQTPHCSVCSLTNLPNTAVFLILGTPQDSDSDGLTDAYEQLVSKTEPNNRDTFGDGMLDGWRVAFGLNPFNSSPGQPGLRSNYTYDPVGRLDLLTGARSETLTNDFEGNILLAH